MVIIYSILNLDGHHKLIRWRLVTHAGIDGYSRMIVFIRSSSNNKAATVYYHFLQAAREFGLPSRVRSDQGKENTLVARHMLQTRGENHGSMITGSSVHNQRIERLWRPVSNWYVLPSVLSYGTSSIQQMKFTFICFALLFFTKNQ